MKKLILILFLILFLSSCNNVQTNNNTDLMTPDEKTNNIETNNPETNNPETNNTETNNPETDNKPTIDTNTPLSYVINEPNFDTRKINSIDEVTMDDFFNLGNRIDIKINISNEELKKLQADYDTGYKSEIYRLASKVVITLTNFGNKYTWEYENVGIRQKGNTSRIPIYNGNGNINLNHYKLSFDETFSDPAMYNSNFINKYQNLEYSNREFLGMSGLDFKWNKNYDETHIKEVYANYLYRASGILVQNTGLSTLSIIEDDKNNKETKLGLCTVYEPATKSMIKRALKSDMEFINMSDWDTEKNGLFGVEGSKYGDLYKCMWSADLTNVRGNVGVSNISGSYTPLYDRKTNKDINYNDQLLMNASTSIKSRNYDEIAKYVDLEYLAISEAVGYIAGNPDSMRYNTNNYMIYLRRTDGKMIFIPIDNDRVFGITRDWNPTGSAMMYLKPLDRKNVNNQNTISLLLDTVLSTKDTESKGIYLEFLDLLKNSSWVKEETFNTYFNIAKESYSDYNFSLTDNSNTSFSTYINNKLKQITSNSEVVDEEENIYFVSTLNNWNANDSKWRLKKIKEDTYTITVTVTKFESDGNYFKFKFNNGNGYDIIDWTVSSDLKTLIKQKGSSVRCYDAKIGDSVTITINTKTLEVSVVIN